MYFLMLLELELLKTVITKDLSIVLTYLIYKVEGEKIIYKKILFKI